jgi:aspartyl protease family protein
MGSQISANRWICPRCGHENNRIADVWMNSMRDNDSVLCTQCQSLYSYQQVAALSGERKTKSRHFHIRLFIVATIILGLLVYLNRTFDVFGYNKDFGQIAYEMMIVLLISATLASGQIWQKVKYLSIWAGIFLVLMTGYSYRNELAGVKDRVMAEFIPAKGYQKIPNAISFPLSSDGHFHIRAQVNGIPIVFLADTGASNIVLSPHDARKIGIKVDRLTFDRLYETANGEVRGSSIQIAHLSIGDIHMDRIGASVNEAEMRDSLLGMTFFNRLKSYEVKNDVLTLFWNDK